MYENWLQLAIRMRDEDLMDLDQIVEEIRMIMMDDMRDTLKYLREDLDD